MADVKHEELNSSDSSVDEAAEAQVTENEAEAQSSGAEGSEERDLPSIVRDAVDGTEQEGRDPASPAEEGQEADQEAKADDAEDDADAEDQEEGPFRDHPAFKQMRSKVRSYKKEVKSLKSELEELRPLKEETTKLQDDATRYRNVQSFLDQNEMSGEEAAELLTIGALMKTNPVEAWKRMKPAVERVIRAAGEVIPDDLAQRVRKGEMTRDAALEVSRSRAQVTAQQTTTTFQQQRAQQTAAVAQAQALQDAAAAWEQQHSSDPDFKAKYEDLRTELQARRGRGEVARSPQEVAQWLDEAYEKVSKRYAKPPHPSHKPEKKFVAGGRVAGNAQPQPKSLEDAINRGLGAA